MTPHGNEQIPGWCSLSVPLKDRKPARVGDVILVYRQPDMIYYRGWVKEENSRKFYEICYDDGDGEVINLRKEKWRFFRRSTCSNKSLRNNSRVASVKKGDRIEIYWPMDDKYYLGVVESVEERTLFRVVFEDGVEDELFLNADEKESDPVIWRHQVKPNRVAKYKRCT